MTRSDIATPDMMLIITDSAFFNDCVVFSKQLEGIIVQCVAEHKYPNGDVRIVDDLLPNSVTRCIVCWSLFPNPNDRLALLIQVLSACRARGLAVVLCVPYLPYARGGMAFLIELLAMYGVTHVVTLDMHNAVPIGSDGESFVYDSASFGNMMNVNNLTSETFLTRETLTIHSISASALCAKEIIAVAQCQGGEGCQGGEQSQGGALNFAHGSDQDATYAHDKYYKKIVLVAPDRGAVARVHAVRDRLIADKNTAKENIADEGVVKPNSYGHCDIPCEVITLTKRRTADGSVSVIFDNDVSVDFENDIMPTRQPARHDLQDKLVIIIDDQIDTGDTLIQTVRYLRKNGAMQIMAFCTHGIFSSGVRDLISATGDIRLTITNSISQDIINQDRMNHKQNVPYISDCMQMLLCISNQYF